MKSYLDSPQYQAMLAQLLKGGPASQYPGQAVANAGAQIVNALALKNYEGKQLEREGKYSSDIANALAPQPVDSVAVTPAVAQTGDVQQRDLAGAYSQPTEKDLLTKLLGSGNPDVTRDFAPMAVQSQMQAQMQANQPITPYQRAQIGENKANNQRALEQFLYGQEAQDKRLLQQQDFTAGQNNLSRQSAREIADVRARSQLGTAGNVQSVQPIYDKDGRVTNLLKVYRDGRVETADLAGKPVISARNDPGALFDQGAATASGRAAGTQAEAFPTTKANFDVIKSTLNSFKDPLVRKEAPLAIGVGSYAPTIPGVNSNFRARVGQLKGQAFLQAFNTLKGGGQITEVEGAKATEAIARLNSAQTEPEFYQALDDASGTFDTLFKSAEQRAQRGQIVPQMQGAVAPQASTPQAAPADQSGVPTATGPNGQKLYLRNGQWVPQ